MSVAKDSALQIIRRYSRAAASMGVFVAVIMLAPVGGFGKTILTWDFSEGTHGWTGNSRVKGLFSSPEGLAFKSIGQDPWIEGPAVDLPGDEMARVTIRMKSNADQAAQMFYGETFSEGRSVRFTVRNDGQWHDYYLIISEKLGAGTRFRLDPCAGAGEITVASIAIETIRKITAPLLDKPRKPDRSKAAPASVKSGKLEFEHYKGRWGNFVLKLDGVEIAAGYQSELIGLLMGDDPEWLNLKDAKVSFKSRHKGSEFGCRAVIKDSSGAEWEIRRIISRGPQDGTLAIETESKVNQDRHVIHVPWLTAFPGLGTFGERKYQGLFAGLEYLCDEPSSSDADITTPEHVRRVPDPAKITFPLVAIANNGRYLGIIWEPSEMMAVTFDSPDRIYNSGAHVMALSAPGVGGLRLENEFCAHTPFTLEANKPLKVTILIIGGQGKTVVPAIEHYVALKGLPDPPQFEGGFDAAVNLLAHGWLDSQINENFFFRHAVWGTSFGPGPAADAAMYIDWLANHVENENLAKRLSDAREHALQRIPPGQPFSSAVSHARLPTAPFVFGRLDAFVQQRRNEAKSLLANFRQDGIKMYRPGRTDYSKTHFARHANGYAGQDMVRILEGATLSADEGLISEALKLLDKQTVLYADTVPRGAQTWEVPLHTPDILASAHMVKAYTLGYIISARQEYLDQARYWAWTGVPFIYLYPPTDGRVGVYATIPVLGATNWKNPVWIGRPVQWCGLAYASALHLLSEYDKNGPWERIAKAITATGLQMSWSTIDKERQGLLPDFFDVKAQVGAGPAINPGTVQAHLAELYSRGKIYDIKRLANHGWFIHAPCAITEIRETKDLVTFVLDGWGDKSYYVLVSGVEKEPGHVLAHRIAQESGELVSFRPANTEFHRQDKYLIVKLQGKSEIQIKY
jgi:hypothetical protein